MNIAKIKRACIAAGACRILHTEEGDWIGDSYAWWSCEGQTFSADQIAVMMQLTEKQRNNLGLQEHTPADLEMRESDFSQVSDADDIAMRRVAHVAINEGEPVAVYETLAGHPRRYLVNPADFAPVEGRAGCELGLRTAADGRELIVAAHGYIAAGICAAVSAESDAGLKLTARLEEIASIILPADKRGSYK